MSEQAAASGIDTRVFRRVMGSFASGVTVITAADGAGMRGMTANAFMSGSLEPPLCVISVAKRAHMHALLMDADLFGVNILARDQEVLSGHFAGRPVPGLKPDIDYSGTVPMIRRAAAHIAAEVAARHDCGDHTLFIGHILHLEGGDRPPLVYHAGRYAQLAEERAGHHVPAPEFW